jgi:hypothetical protein
LGAIIIAILFGIIGFLIPVLIALVIAAFFGFIVFGLASLAIPVVASLAAVLGNAGILGFLGTILAVGAAAIGLAAFFIVFLILLIPALIGGAILGIIGFMIGIPVGIFFGSLIGGLGGVLVGGAVGGLGGIFVAQLAFLPLIVFVALFAFVLGTAAYMAFGPILGTTNDYRTPMSKGIYSIYLKYENMDGSQVVNNIDQLLKDFLDVAKSAFGPKMYNTIKSLEIIVDTTDFTNPDDIGKAAEETLNLLPAIVN